jgi:predicted deacylase
MNLERIEAILQLIERQSHVGELSAEGDGWRIRVRKAPGLPTFLADEPLTAEEERETPERLVVQADRVGIYRAAGKAPRVGDAVAAGAILGQIDSMGILNAVTTEAKGRLVETLVEDGDPVEYGQVLFALEPERAGEAAS